MATWSHVTIKKRYISTSPKAVTAKLGKVEIYNKGPPSIRSFDALSTWSSDHVTDKKRYIPTSTRTMAKKLDRVVGSNACLLSIKSRNLLITWSKKSYNKWKFVMSSFSRDLWLSNQIEGWLMSRRSHMSNSTFTYPSNQAVTWGHVKNELHYIFILWSLLPLNLTGWWLMKLKCRRWFN